MTYLYIDDDSSERVEGTVQGFGKENYIKIVPNQPQSTWEEQIKSVIEYASIDGNLDGLILDLRLDDYPNSKNEKANFRGTSLAQEIRTRQKERSLKFFPIVLFSGNDKLLNSLESSGKDLFDICIEKDNITEESFLEYRNKLFALASGYKKISEAAVNLRTVLEVDASIIDQRFLSELNTLLSEPIHVLARFIINELIEKQGLLIDEQILAARLGIDIEKSEDWIKILEYLSFSKYSGIFNLGWKRWWMPIIDNWWRDFGEAKTYLRSTSASQRVKLIKEKLGLENLQPANKIEKSDSEEFWTVCKGYNLPLDPVDGLMIEGQENLFPWQDATYVSIDAALKRKNISKWKKVAKLEEENLSELEEQYKK